MKEFDLYIKKLNAITKKYDSPLLEQTDIDWDFISTTTRLFNKANKGVEINPRNVTEKDIFNLADLEDIFKLFTFGDLSTIELENIKKIHRWVNISAWNAEPGATRHTYGMRAGLSIGDAAQGSEEKLKARYGPNATKGNVWKTVTTRTKLINDIVAKVESGTYTARKPQTQTPYTTSVGQELTIEDIQKANLIAKQSNYNKSIFKALKEATGKTFTFTELEELFNNLGNRQATIANQLSILWKEAEQKISDLQSPQSTTNPNGWQGRPPHDYGLGKWGLENLTVADAFRGFENRDVESAYTDLANWASQPRENGTSWRDDMEAVIPTMIELENAVNTMEDYKDNFIKSEEEKKILQRAAAWKSYSDFISSRLAEIQARLDQLAQRREQSAIDSAQRQEDKDAALVEALKQQQEALNKIKSKITDTANAIRSREAAVPLTGYNPHRLVGGAKEVVSVKVYTYQAVRQAFEIIDKVKSAFVSGDDETWMNYLKNDIRKPIIDNLKETYVVLAANEKAFTKQVEPYSENGEITDTVSVIYGLDFTDISTVEVPPGGPIDQSLTYGLTKATTDSLQLLAKDIPTIIRNNKKSDSFDWPPDIEINYDNLNNLADKRAEGLATSREKVLRSYYSDQMRTSTQQALSAEEEKRLAELAEEERLLFERNRLARELFRKYDLASMIAYKDFDKAVELWNEVKAPFLQTIELYKKTNASIMDIENLRSEYNSILYEYDTTLAAFGEWGKKQAEAIDQEIIQLVNDEVDQLDQKTAMVAKKLQAIKSRADKSMRSLDQDERAFVFGNTDIDTDEEPDLIAEFNAMRNSGVFQYMDKVQLEEIRNRVNDIQSDFNTVASKFKVYEDDFMVMDRRLNQEVTRLNSEPFVDASELEDLKNLYLEYFDERIDARNRLSRFTEETIVKDRFFKTSNHVGYLLQYKMIDFMNNDIGNLQKKLPPLTSIGWTSYKIHGVMNEEQSYENIKQNISDIYTIVDDMNSQISTLGASFGLPAGFENFVNGPHWNKLDDLFTDINMINGVRQGNSNDILAFRDYVSSFRNAIEYLDFLANEFKYQKNIEPHQNPVIQQTLIYAEDLPFRNQFRWRTLNLLQSSKKATNEKGTGAYDLLLKGEYDRFLKPEFRNRQTWQGGKQSND